MAASASKSPRNHRQVLASQGGQQVSVLRIYLLQLEQQGEQVEAAQHTLQLPLTHLAVAQELQLSHFTNGKTKLHQVQQR